MVDAGWGNGSDARKGEGEREWSDSSFVHCRKRRVHVSCRAADGLEMGAGAFLKTN